MRLWLVRHAVPLVAPGVCYGRSDLPADVQATQQAAEALAGSLPVGLQVMISPLQRCGQLAQALQVLRPDLRCKTEPRIAEMDFGAWEGRPWASIDRTELESWTADFADYPAGGSGETVRAFMRRVGLAWAPWRGEGEDALWVTHAGVDRAVQLLAQGVDCPADAGQWPVEGLGHGQWRVLQG